MTAIDLPPETPPSQALTKIEKQQIERADVSPLDMEPTQFAAALDRRKANRAALMKWIKEALVDGVDFGSIPTKRGPSKPSLRKPGAEKICGMLNVKASFPTLPEYELAVLNGKVIKQVILRCELISGTGKVAEGIGARSVEQDYGDLNKCLKMAEKSAHIDATLRMAGLSEIFTQDIEDMPQQQNFEPRNSNTRQPNNSGASAKNTRVAAEPPKQNTARTEAAATTGTAKPAKQTTYATKESRMRFLNHIGAAPGQPGEQMMWHFLMALPQHAILESESVVDMDLGLVPITANQTIWFTAALQDFERGGDAEIPFYNDLDNSGAGSDKPERKPDCHPARGSTEPELAAAPITPTDLPDEFFSAVCPVPRKGMKRDQYLTNPDTIGSMYEARHDDEYLRKRLFGLVNNFVPTGWTKRDGTKMPPNKADIEFREALDAFADWAEKKGERI